MGWAGLGEARRSLDSIVESRVCGATVLGY
jgi:hypothetical protein